MKGWRCWFAVLSSEAPVAKRTVPAHFNGSRTLALSRSARAQGAQKLTRGWSWWHPQVSNAALV